MGRPPRVLAAALVGLALTAKADGNDLEVLQVGGASLRVSDVEKRLAKMPAFQRRAYGATDAEVRRRFVDEVLLPELLAAEDARRHARIRLSGRPHGVAAGGGRRRALCGGGEGARRRAGTRAREGGLPPRGRVAARHPAEDGAAARSGA